MKILFCSPLLAYEGHFARQAVVKSLTFADAGMDVTILGFPETLEGIPDNHPRVRYISIQRDWTPRKKARIQAWREKCGLVWLFIVEIWWVHWFAFRYAKQRGIDLIFISDVEPWLLIPERLLAILFGRGTPIVGCIPTVYYRFKTTVWRNIRLTTHIRGLLNLCTAHLLPLGMDLVCEGEPARKYLFRYRMDRVHVIHDFFQRPDKILSKKEARHCLKLSGERRILLLFGLATHSKGSDLLFQAMEGMRPLFDVCVVGKVGGQNQPDWGCDRFHGTEWEQHLHLVSRFVTEEERCLYFSACDAVIVPYRYGFMMISGMVLDAIAFGKAVIACDQFEIGRYTREYRLGLLFKTEDVADLRRALEEFSVKPDAWFIEIERHCRAMDDEFSMPNVGRRYRQLFASVLERGRRTPEDGRQTTDDRQRRMTDDGL
ncbi:MAG: glycosyltransferase [Kiritimatiellaeota bacterium]|nr:glycosyltransferase [Kiritimatiellota bacterium]